MGPDKRSWRERFLGAGAFRFTGTALRGAAFLDADFLVDGALRDTDFFPAAFFVAFFLDFFLPAGFLADAFFLTFLRDAFLAADFFADFLAVDLADDLADFLAVGFRDDFFPADFLRAADLPVDAVLALLFFLLTLRCLPVVFLPADDLPDAAFFLPPPAAFRFLLAAFFAGIIDSCRSEKNAELYIARPNMEAHFQPFFRGSGRVSTAG